MSTDPIRAYLDARNNLEQAAQRAERMVGIILGAAIKLRDWKRVMVSNANVGFPAEIALTTQNSIRADEWPTAQQLAEALAQWHQARSAARSAWSAVPSSDRPGIQPPE